MTSYIMVSVLSGLLGGGYGLVTYGSGLGPVIGWYLIGGWIGLGLMVLTVVMLGNATGSDNSDFSPSHQ